MGTQLPAWLAHLEEDDYQFIKRFLLASGSLKELAQSYQVSYPTIRLQVDRLISHIKGLDDRPPADAFDAKLRRLVADGELPSRLGKELLRLHNSVTKGVRKST